MNTEAFTGRAKDYVKARPAYPKAAIEYVYSLAPVNAVFADIGAGTGKLTELLAFYGNEIAAIEPNADMREQLAVTLAPFGNIKIFNGSAEETKLPDNSVDVIISAQALNRFDIGAFRAECDRISKQEPVIITLFNDSQPYSRSRYDKSTSALYRNPVIREFPNPHYFTREKWIQYFISMEGVPRDTNSAYIVERNEIFERNNIDGILRLDLITIVFSER